MKLDRKQMAKHDEMAKKIPQLIEEYFGRPEITLVAVSLKKTNDKLVNTLCFTFGVKEKLPADQVSNPIPDSIFGYPTDVIEFNRQPREAPNFEIDLADPRFEKTDPLIGGISISADGALQQDGKEVMGGGTLGLMMNMKGDKDRPYMVTAAHVVAGVGTKRDSDICQQSKWDTTLEYCHNCAELGNYYSENVMVNRDGNDIPIWLDCAVAKKGWFRSATIGKVYGVNQVINGFANINASLIGKTVVKSGITTGITEGVISSITMNYNTTKLDGTPVVAYNQIMITSQGNTQFSDHGDSGSAVFTKDDYKLIGINTASSIDGKYAYSSPTDAVLSKWPNLTFGNP